MTDPGEEAAHLPARVAVHEPPQPSHEERAAGEEHQGEGHLADDQGCCAGGAASGRRFPGVLLQGVVHVATRRHPGREAAPRRGPRRWKRGWRRPRIVQFSGMSTPLRSPMTIDLPRRSLPHQATTKPDRARRCAPTSRLSVSDWRRMRHAARAQGRAHGVLAAAARDARELEVGDVGATR